MNAGAYGQSEMSDKVNGSRQMIGRMCNAGSLTKIIGADSVAPRFSALLLPSDPLRCCRRGFG